MVDQSEGVTAAQLAHWPLLEWDALYLDLEDAADPMLVGLVGAIRARVMGRPGGEVLAQGVGAVGEPVGLVYRLLGFPLER